MKRFHALEWEDLNWFPKSWRDFGTDYLMFIATKFDIYKSILPYIEKGLDASGTNEWVDCASGGGGALINLTEALRSKRANLKVIMTDYYPNHKAFDRTKKQLPEQIEYELDSVNALELPLKFKGKFRTLFGAFHHFRPSQAKQILQNAVDTESPIAIFEPVGRDAASWISMLFVIPNTLLLTPFIRPVRWSVLPFIYIIPIIPLYILWDGIASILRTYSENERWELIKSVKGFENYNWEVGKVKNGPAAIHFLYGQKKMTSETTGFHLFLFSTSPH